MYPTSIIVDVRVKRYPASVGDLLFSGFRIIGRASVYAQTDFSPGGTRCNPCQSVGGDGTSLGLVWHPVCQTKRESAFGRSGTAGQKRSISLGRVVEIFSFCSLRREVGTRPRTLLVGSVELFCRTSCGSTRHTLKDQNKNITSSSRANVCHGLIDKVWGGPLLSSGGE
jgi:hypothetical protein